MAKRKRLCTPEDHYNEVWKCFFNQVRDDLMRQTGVESRKKHLVNEVLRHAFSELRELLKVIFLELQSSLGQGEVMDLFSGRGLVSLALLSEKISPSKEEVAGVHLIDVDARNEKAAGQIAGKLGIKGVEFSPTKVPQITYGKGFLRFLTRYIQFPRTVVLPSIEQVIMVNTGVAFPMSERVPEELAEVAGLSMAAAILDPRKAREINTATLTLHHTSCPTESVFHALGGETRSLWVADRSFTNLSDPVEAARSHLEKSRTRNWQIKDVHTIDDKGTILAELRHK